MGINRFTMYINLLFLCSGLIFISCGSEPRITNVSEARKFLADNEWHDSKASFQTLDGNFHTAGSSIVFTEQQVESNKSWYTYKIQHKNGGDVVSQAPYFEITWFDNYLNEIVYFYLYEDGGGSLNSTRWKLRCFDNVGKPVTRISNSAVSTNNEISEGNQAKVENVSTSEQGADDYKNAFVCPMHCSKGGSQKPGKCIVCGIDLIRNPNVIFADMYYLESDTLLSGTVKYCDVDGLYSLVVKIDGSSIIIERFAGEKNEYNADKNTPQEITRGEISDGKVILTKDSEGELKELYKISKGVLYEASYEATQTEYHQCPLDNSIDAIDPIEGNYIVNVSVDQYDNAGMIFSTPMPEEKRIISKSENGFELLRIDKKAYTKVLISKSDEVNFYKVKIINLDNVGFKDINCTAFLQGNTLAFQYKVPYEESKKLPKNTLQPGEWNILRFSCEKINEAHSKQ